LVVEAVHYSVVLFHSMTGALHAEKLFKNSGIAIKLIPVPRHLSSDCGICLRFDRRDDTGVREILDSEQIEIQGICPV
jgi:hypothetical protein